MLTTYPTIHKGAYHKQRKPVLTVPESGRFKIMQVSDLHLSTGVGECRDAVPDRYGGGLCEADPRSLAFVSKLLEDERPDLVILSGDQINGNSAPDAPTVS